MSFWGKKRNEDNDNDQPEPQQSGLAAFDILGAASKLIDEAGGLPESKGGHADNQNCVDVGCPLNCLENVGNMIEWAKLYQRQFGDDFVLGLSTPDTNPMAQYIKSCIPRNMELSDARLMTGAEGKLFVITIDMTGVAVWEHNLPEWSKTMILDMIELAHETPEITASQTLTLLAKFA